MFRPNWKHVMFGAVAIAALMSFGSSSANACWGWGRCWDCCYTPCYSTCYSPSYYSVSCCDPCGGYYVWRPGPIRRLLFGPYRYVGGCWTSYGSWAPYSYQVGTVTTETMQQPTLATPQSTEGMSDRRPSMPALPAEPSPKVGDRFQEPPPSTPPSTPPPPPSSPLPPPEIKPSGPTSTELHTRADSGLLTIWVPEDAIVEINGLRTKSAGSRRAYVSYGLEPGKYYPYKIRALIWTSENLPGGLEEDGQPRSMEGEWQWLERTVYLTAGAHERIAFSPDPKIDEDLRELLAHRQQKFFGKLAAAEQGE